MTFILLAAAALCCVASSSASIDADDGLCPSSGQCLRPPAGSNVSSHYYWPHGKGHPHHYGKSPYTGSFSGFPCNLSASLKWSWHYPGNKYKTMIMGSPAIDGERNLYLTILGGIKKFSPDGKILWSWDKAEPWFYLMNTPALMDGLIYTCSTDAKVHALDMDTGRMVWTTQLKTQTGIEGDNGFVVARDGRVILDGDRSEATANKPNKIFCLNGTTGDLLWEFMPDIGVWNFLPMFPQSGGMSDGTIVFQSISGSAYRVNVTTGEQLWRAGQRPFEATFTDGGAALGPNNVLYTVSSLGWQVAHRSDRGGLHAFRVADGQLLWENTSLHAGVFTWPVVAQLEDGAKLSVVTGVGSLASYPLQEIVLKMSDLLQRFAAAGLVLRALITVRKFDTDGDGALMAEEFQHFFEQVLLRSRRSFVQWKAHYEFFVEKKEGDPWSVHESIKQLGEGSFGVTHLVRDRRSQQTRVLKAVNKAASNMSPQELEQEIKGLKMLDHPHVVKLFEYYEDQEHIFLLMEEARGGELAAVIREQQRAGSRVSERWAATVMTQVLKAIAYCHGRRLMHKDLKSENIMLLRSVEGGAFPHAVIIDLGMAEMFGSSGGAPDGTRSIAPASGRPTKDAEQLLYHRIRSRHAGGTPYTMAPEVWMAYQGTGTFGMKCDVYSLGVVLFQLLTGDFPFLVPAIDPSQWLARIARGPAAEPLAPCSPQAQGLARWMLASEAERPTAREALGHEWFALKAQEAVVQLSEQLRKALCEFSGKNEFQKAVLLQAASQMRAVDLPKVNATFCTCDTDCNGYLTREQLLGALRAAGADEPSAQRAATAIDLDKNGRIEYTEFVAACLALHSDRLEAFLWQIFQKLDSNGSATLTRVEIEQFLRDSELRGLGFAPSGTEIQQIVNELDRDRNGHVKFSAFRDYIIPRGPAPRNFTC